METKPPFRVLFVCTGNICRSPTADGILRHMVREAGMERVVEVDSAGTHGYHTGEPPDPRSTATAQAHGVDLSRLRARAVEEADFKQFDWIVAMDSGHHDWLERLAGPEDGGKIQRFMGFLGQPEGNVADPYYGGNGGFEAVYSQIEQGCRKILALIQADEVQNLGNFITK